LVFSGLHRLCPEVRQEQGRLLAAGPEHHARTLAALPELRGLLEMDIQFAFEADPAATGTDEVVACYPALCIAIYRAAHRLLREGRCSCPA